jgi:hypothetical protein
VPCALPIEDTFEWFLCKVGGSGLAEVLDVVSEDALFDFSWTSAGSVRVMPGRSVPGWRGPLKGILIREMPPFSSGKTGKNFLCASSTMNACQCLSAANAFTINKGFYFFGLVFSFNW